MKRFQQNLKIPVLSFGVIFVLTGVALVSIGTIYELTLTDLNQVIPESYRHLRAAPRLTIAAGTATFIFSFIGCAGAILTNRKLLLIYAALLVVICILQVSNIIFMITQDYEGLSQSINGTLPNIFQNFSNSDFINMVQNELRCCGPTGSQFWNETMNMPFPLSCCADECAHLYHDGCQTAIVDFVVEAATVMEVTLSVFCVVEIVGAVLAVSLAGAKRKRFGYSDAILNED